MRIRRAVIMGALVVGLAVGVVAGSVSGAAANGDTKATPSGFQTLKVPKAGFSIAVPAAWGAVDVTKKSANKILTTLKNRFPSLASQLPGDATSFLQKNVVLLAIEKTTGFAANINVIRIPGLVSSPSISDISPSVRQIAPDAKFSNTRVAGTRAVKATYQLSATSKNVLVHASITQYALVGSKGGLIITLTAGTDNPRTALFTTIIKSVKLL